ncbi:aquaporin [Cadophora sp. MPI-SDFR-AT-0126]|nr:aquaporin [Leotiomycetes sp. MPI-SDFR-AT-0126]
MFSMPHHISRRSLKPGNSLPMLHLEQTLRNTIVVVLGEFVGTFLFLFMAFAGTQIAHTPSPNPQAASDAAAYILIALTFALSLTTNIWAFYRVTGGLFNPAVTLALWLCGGMSTLRSILLVPTQFAAGIAAAGLVSCMYPGDMNVETLLGGGTSITRGLFIEVFLTAQLIFVILMLAVDKQTSTYLAPIGIGTAFFTTELSGVYFTGASLNPARSLGPATINHSFPGYFWIYVVGPGLGSLLACAFYEIFYYLHWKDAIGDDSNGNDIEKNNGVSGRRANTRGGMHASGGDQL